MQGNKDLETFWAKVDKEGPEVEVRNVKSKCWMWLGSERTQGGYGNFWCKDDGKNHLAHKWIYEKYITKVPQGMVLDHQCNNGPLGCVNYNHLIIATIRDNVLRGTGITAQNAAKTHCIHGHEITGERWYKGKIERYCKVCRSQYIHSQEYKEKKKEADKLYALENKEAISSYQKQWREEKKKDIVYMEEMKKRKRELERKRLEDPLYREEYNRKRKEQRAMRKEKFQKILDNI